MIGAVRVVVLCDVEECSTIVHVPVASFRDHFSPDPAFSVAVSAHMVEAAAVELGWAVIEPGVIYCPRCTKNFRKGRL